MENSVGTLGREAAISELGTHYAALARAQRRLRGRDAMQPGRLTAPQVSLLRPLVDNGPMPSGQLAEAAGLTPATATHMLDQLAVAGIVERVRRADDRRVVTTELTQEGAKKLAERLAEMAQAWEEALSGFDAAELDSACDVVEAICSFVDGL